ncbi:MAG: hypothetical protein K5681_00675 [Treponema sp.]|nr:hypothetical protein [Treponema sp.]
MTDAVLCVDIGTTSLKAGLVTANGEVVSVSTVKFNSADDKYHIALTWLPALKRAIKKLTSLDSIFVRALSISGNGPTVVSEDGTTILWNDAYQADAEKCGNSLFIPKLFALKELFPQQFNESKYIFSGPEYLIWQLTGKALTILPEARFEGAYWNNDSLARAGLPSNKMPAFLTVDQKYAEISGSRLSELGLPLVPEKLPVFGAGPDFVAALIGTNTLSPGRICDRSGSSEGLNFCVPAAIRHPQVRTLPSVIPGLWNISVLIPRSGRMPEKQRLESLKRAVELLKELAGENGVDFPQEIFVTGGQTKNPAYMGRKALALGIRLLEANCDDAELLGDACVAWFGLGIPAFDSLQAAAASIVHGGRHYEAL